MSSIQSMFLIPKGAQENLLITQGNTEICLINRRIKNLITLVPRSFLLVDKGEHLVFILLCKANLECKEIHASDWLKPPMPLWLTLFFYALHARFGFAIQKAYL